MAKHRPGLSVGREHKFYAVSIKNFMLTARGGSADSINIHQGPVLEGIFLWGGEGKVVVGGSWEGASTLIG